MLESLLQIGIPVVLAFLTGRCLMKLPGLVPSTCLTKLPIAIPSCLPLAPASKSSGFFLFTIGYTCSKTVLIVSIHEECGGIQPVTRSKVSPFISGSSNSGKFVSSSAAEPLESRVRLGGVPCQGTEISLDPHRDAHNVLRKPLARRMATATHTLPAICA